MPAPLPSVGAMESDILRMLPKENLKPRPGYRRKRSVFVGSCDQGQALRVAPQALTVPTKPAPEDTASWPEKRALVRGQRGRVTLLFPADLVGLRVAVCGRIHFPHVRLLVHSKVVGIARRTIVCSVCTAPVRSAIGVCALSGPLRKRFASRRYRLSATTSARSVTRSGRIMNGSSTFLGRGVHPRIV
jgi:hypothetical protein